MKITTRFLLALSVAFMTCATSLRCAILNAPFTSYKVEDVTLLDGTVSRMHMVDNMNIIGEGRATIDTGTLPAGLYLVRVTTPTGITTRKVVF